MQAGSKDPILSATNVPQASRTPQPTGLTTNGPSQPMLTPSQIELFKKQILAYKLISSNVSIPATLKTAISHIDVNTTPNAPQDAKRPPINLLLDEDIRHLDVDSVDEPPRHDVIVDQVSHLPPGSEVALKLLYNILHPIAPYPPGNQTSQCFPAVLPEPFATGHFLQERERLLQTRINERIQQLEDLDTTQLGETLKLKAVIELKALRLVELQKRVRSDVIGAMNKVTSSLSAVDPLLVSARDRKAGSLLRTAKFVERHADPVRISFAAGPRADRSRKEKMRHQEFLQSISERVKEFSSFHKSYCQQKINKIAKGILHFHSHYEKEEMKRLDKLAKDRINALKADDEEAYLKLLDEQKDTRLTHLIRQTDLFLESLTSSVVAQKLDTLHKSSVAQPPTVSDIAEELEQVKEGKREGKVDYYATAHKIFEAVIQPTILVGGKLKEYQLKGLQWMISLFNNRLNGILADEMGLGKTIQTIALISYLLEFKNQNGPYLVIVPLSTMTNWSLEFEKWAPTIAKVEYKGTPQVRKSIQGELKLGKFNVLLTTYEYVIKDKSFLSKIKWLYMIIDEGHRMKNTESKLVATLTSYYSTRYRLILTGTPLQNNLPELWALLNFVLPKIFNSSRSFDEWFNAPFANTGEKFELNEEEMLLIIRRLHKVLRPFLLRRLKKDVEAELPDKIERIIKCPMSSLQIKLYNLVKEKTLLTSGTASSGIRRFNNTIMQLRKICNHPFVFEEVEQQVNPYHLTNELLFRVAGKFELLRRMLGKLKATGHKVLMFFQMTMVMTVMEDFMTLEGFKYLRLDGSTKAEDRSVMLKHFNAADSPYFIFLLSTRAGGLGLNLQSADTVIIFDSDWNPHQDLQAQDRAHRIGQTKEVRIFRLVTHNSVEEVILARAQYKLNLDGKVIQAGKFDHKSTNEEREAMLRALLDSEQQKTAAKKTLSKKKGKREPGDSEDEAADEGEECEDIAADDAVLGDDELNEILARNADELILFKQMDENYDKELKEKNMERLISERELPKIYLNDHAEAAEEMTIEQMLELEEMQHRRNRGGKKSYDDHLTEEQWLEQFRVSDDDGPSKTPKKAKRKSSDKAKALDSTEDEYSVPLAKLTIKRKLQHPVETDSKRSKLILKLPTAKESTEKTTLPAEKEPLEQQNSDDDVAYSQSFSSSDGDLEDLDDPND